MWAATPVLISLHSATANRRREAETFRAGSPIPGRHCASTGNEWLRRSSLALQEKQLRFQLLARARKLGAGEQDRTLPAIVWQHRTVARGERTRSASTHR